MCPFCPWTPLCTQGQTNTMDHDKAYCNHLLRHHPTQSLHTISNDTLASLGLHASRRCNSVDQCYLKSHNTCTHPTTWTKTNVNLWTTSYRSSSGTEWSQSIHCLHHFKVHTPLPPRGNVWHTLTLATQTQYHIALHNLSAVPRSWPPPPNTHTPLSSAHCHLLRSFLEVPPPLGSSSSSWTASCFTPASPL